ncbi:MAG: nicotinate-nicotinamide nucleotide adenylyltransferase [Actinobacteria bacterium]|nr:nicotinate-nicotinamide nucleotide adenylyltransferase [Actinomycetota bacterium]
MVERLGVLGGTFDPPHIAHLLAALDVRRALDLDRVLLVVANEPWQKVGARPVTPAADRLAMVEAAVADVDGLEASGIEIDRGGPSYTADTLTELTELGRELFLIVGADVDLDTWVRSDDVRRLAQLVVVTRPGGVAPVHSRVVEIPALDVSGSALRHRMAEGRSVRFLVPDGALRCIRERGLYAVGG